MAVTGIASYILDILPAAAIVLLAVSFLRNRSRCRREEEKLRKTIEAFREAEQAEDSREKE